jgi:hypothetical protein
MRPARGEAAILIAVSALRFLYKVTLHKKWAFEDMIPAPKKPQTLPVVLSPEEVLQFLDCIPGLKHRTILTTCYPAGLRISEAVRLKPSDIDSPRMVIRVEQGKGQKDRYVMLSPKLLESLRNWWRVAKPKEWLFPATLPVHTSAKTPSNRHARKRTSVAAFPNRSPLIRSATPSPSICWSPVPTCAPSNCCWGIAAWRPPPGIYESPPPRRALPRVPSIYFRGQSLPNRNPLRPSTSERQADGSPKFEVADVFRRYGAAYRQQHGSSMSVAQRRVMTAIEVCRTAVLGGHLEQCDQCGHERNAYNSCANRHCPKCQSLARAEWLENRRSELLDTQYFHVVFTLPEQIAPIAYQNKKAVYGILFSAAADTLRTIAADPKHLGAEIGFFAVLHTWGPEPASPSPSALCRCRWWSLSGRHPMDFLPTWVLLARASPVPFVPAPHPGIPAHRL